MSSGEYPRIEAGRADLIELATRGAKEMVAADELAQKKLEHDGVPEQQGEAYGVIVKKLWTGPAGDWFSGSVISQLPGADGITEVRAKTVDGIIAMCHRAYLNALTAGNVCDVKTARRRAAEANFYVATVL